MTGSLADRVFPILRQSVLSCLLGVSGALAVLPPAQADEADNASVPAPAPFTVSSDDLQDQHTVPRQQIYGGAGCQGGNISPALHWQHAPAGTVSFAITLFDMDAPGRGWWHWAVAGIPANIDRLAANAAASGALHALGAVQARNDFDDTGYSGPCPPPGRTHRYILTVYALNTASLRVDDGRPAPFFDHEIRASTLAAASMTVLYGR